MINQSNCSDQKIVESYNKIHDDNDAINWMLITYAQGSNDKDWCLVAKGNDGLDGIKALVNDSFIGYGYLRIFFDNQNLSKFVLIKFIGKNNSPYRKFQLTCHLADVEKVISSHTIFLEVESADQLTEEDIRNRLKVSYGPIQDAENKRRSNSLTMRVNYQNHQILPDTNTSKTSETSSVPKVESQYNPEPVPSFPLNASNAKPTTTIRYAQDDTSPTNSRPLQHLRLGPRFIRTTNVTSGHHQTTGNCYAHAATSAYLNTLARIYNVKSICKEEALPSFAECLRIADYINEPNASGNCQISIQKLEEYFHFGIQCKLVNGLPLIRDVLMTSIILCFTTSPEGYEAIASGKLIKLPNGEPESEGHAVLVEGYDFNNDTCICKNSWGKSYLTHQRFDIKISALHAYYFYQVFWTLDSIDPRLLNVHFNINEFQGKLCGKPIKCAWMDQTAADYCSDYVSEYRPDGKYPLNYIGYDVDEWINLMCKREQKTII